MPGLSIGIGGGQRVGSPSVGLGQTGGATIAQTAYGAGDTSSPKGIGYHHTFLGVQGAALAYMLFLRHSLPSAQKKTFDLIIMTDVGFIILWGAARVWSHRQLMFGPNSGGMHGLAKLTKAVTG